MRSVAALGYESNTPVRKKIQKLWDFKVYYLQFFCFWRPLYTELDIYNFLSERSHTVTDNFQTSLEFF